MDTYITRESVRGAFIGCVVSVVHVYIAVVTGVFCLIHAFQHTRGCKGNQAKVEFVYFKMMKRYKPVFKMLL